MSSTSSHGSMSTGSRCSLSASSRGSLSSLNHSMNNSDGLHLSSSVDYYPSSYHPVSNHCPPIYETPKYESSYPVENARFDLPNTAQNLLISNLNGKGSTSSRDSVSLSSISPPISPLHVERERGSFMPSYQGMQSRGEISHYSDTNCVDRMPAYCQVRLLEVHYKYSTSTIFFCL